MKRTFIMKLEKNYSLKSLTKSIIEFI